MRIRHPVVVHLSWCLEKMGEGGGKVSLATSLARVYWAVLGVFHDTAFGWTTTSWAVLFHIIYTRTEADLYKELVWLYNPKWCWLIWFGWSRGFWSLSVKKFECCLHALQTSDGLAEGCNKFLLCWWHIFDLWWLTSAAPLYHAWNCVALNRWSLSSSHDHDRPITFGSADQLSSADSTYPCLIDLSMNWEDIILHIELYLYGIVLPDSVVSGESVNSFKSSLDKFWSMRDSTQHGDLPRTENMMMMMHDFVYDYWASPLAAGSV